MKMKIHRSYIDAFNPEGKDLDVCKNCGVCLQKCPVMQMEKKESLAEKHRLQNGEEPLRVLNECTLCFNCNHYCPHGLNPFALIMERMAQKVVKSGNGIPENLQYLFTGHGNTSVFADIYQMLSDKENAILDKWEVPPPQSREVLFIGCIGREIPLKIENSKVLKSLPKYGPRNACCGDLCFRYGDFNIFSQTVNRTSELFEELRTKRLICYCGGCTNTFKNIWKDYLGVTLPFEIISIWEWLWEKVQSKSLHIQKKFSMKVALTDSCYSTELGDNFLQSVRGLHHAAGIEIVELKNNQYNNLCCGAMGMARDHTDFSAPFSIARKKVKQVTDTQATDLAYYCPGCYLTLADTCKNAGIKTHYSLDYILSALGDEFSVEMEDKLSIQSSLIVKKLLNSI
jgi:Fe-S oxidoreductase